jgi:hypothetical protein
MLLGLGFVAAGSGYGAPPALGNRAGWNEAGRILGWSPPKTTRSYALVCAMVIALLPALIIESWIGSN